MGFCLQAELDSYDVSTMPWLMPWSSQLQSAAASLLKVSQPPPPPTTTTQHKTKPNRCNIPCSRSSRILASSLTSRPSSSIRFRHCSSCSAPCTHRFWRQSGRQSKDSRANRNIHHHFHHHHHHHHHPPHGKWWCIFLVPIQELPHPRAATNSVLMS